jgi:hypothetical protein
MTTKRGYTLEEALAYTGVRRRTFDAEWRPLLHPMRQGACLIFDVHELDDLFDRFKTAALETANDDQDDSQAQNAPRNGRPIQKKGVQPWAERQRGSTPMKTEAGRSTSGSPILDFASAASQVMKRQKGG